MSMTVIEHIEVGSGGAASIEFTSIAQTFTDLMLKYSVRTSGAVVVRSVILAINGTSANLSERFLYGTGSSATSNSQAGASTAHYAPGASATASTFNSGELYLPNYTGSTNKSISAESVTENNATEAWQAINAVLNSSTAAITSITLTPGGGDNFVQYSSATLFGITAGSSGGVTVS